MDVVHGCEPAQQLAARLGEGAEDEAVVLVHRVGFEAVIDPHVKAVVYHSFVVGDRCELHPVDGIASLVDAAGEVLVSARPHQLVQREAMAVR